MKYTKIFGISLTCIVAAVVLLAMFFSGIFSPPIITRVRAIDTYATTESVSDLSMGMNEFSFDIYQHISSDSSDNVFISPYSIFVALAMTYEGAKGDTALEMKDVLGFEQNDEVSLCSFGKIYNLLNIDAEYTLNTANALWTMKDYPFLTSYLNFIDNYYMGKATEVDFTKADETVELINTWVEENTGGKIEDMLSPSDIHPATLMILSNAIYFKGLWKTQFDSELTIDREFTLASNESIHVPTMIMTGSEESFNYTETEDMQILELPYVGDTVSMVLLLPKENNLSVVKDQLNSENLDSWIDAMEPAPMDIFLPKFTFETEYSLNTILVDMGLDLAFSYDADFSGMNGYGNIYIDKVLHKAFVEVNEEGTEAAAATTVHMVLTSLPPPATIFNADHPFAFLIQHKETGTILFMGTVQNPLE